MKKQVKYTGYSTTPSDYENPDGDLTTSLNLLNEDGALKPLMQPKDICSFPTGCRVIYTHTTPTYSNYIVSYWSRFNPTELYWINEADAHGTLNLNHLHFIHSFGPRVQVLRITSVGNTLCVLCSDGLHYILWSADDSDYTYLGQKPEFLELSFGLSENYFEDYASLLYDDTNQKKQNHAYIATFDSDLDFGYFLETDDIDEQNLIVKNEHSDEFQDLIWGALNKVTSFISSNGRFYAPFFVRYCYRMYDGTMWMHSAPVFMPVLMPKTFNVALEMHMVRDSQGNLVIDFSHYSSPFSAFFFPQDVALTCKLIRGSIDNLKMWSDIIKSVDIFVSPPITREDTEEKIKNIHYENSGSGIGYNLTVHKDTEEQIVGGKWDVQDHSRWDETWDSQEEKWVKTHTNNDDYIYNILLNFPKLSDEKYLEKIHNVSNFYKVKSFDLENIDSNISNSEYKEIEIDKSTLLSLAVQESMKDDYKTHNVILPLHDDDGYCVTNFFNINRRLFITAPCEKIYDGFSMGCMVPRCSYPMAHRVKVKRIDVFLMTDDGEKTVQWTDGDGYDSTRTMMENCVLFYPDNRAVRMDVYVEYRAQSYLYTFPMESCPLLNGAFTMGGVFNVYYDESAWESTTSPFPEVDIKNKLYYPYKLYSSDVNNPFIFPSTGINTVGSGIITSIATVNEPVSTGQFGYSDIYIFTTDGLWVAKINTDGSLHDINPVSRDVCINPDGMVQLSKSVLFATKRGIMLVSGSTVQCVSDPIATEQPFNVIDSLPHADELHAMLHPNADTCLPTKPFLAFLAEAMMLFDYIHQRVIVYNPSKTNDTPDYTYAYVFSLKSKLWGMMYSNLAYSLNSYPDALAISHDNHLVSFSATDETQSKGLLVTRPLKLGDGDTLKSIHTLIQRGMFQRGDVKTVIYGSRDLYSWHLVASSTTEAIRSLRGTPYKYFRIAALTNFTEGKSLYGATIDAEPRHTSQIH